MNNNGAKSVVAFLLCAAMLVGGGAVGYGMATDWTYEKGVQIEQPDETPDDETPEDEGGMQVSEVEGNGVSLMSTRISPSDYSAYGISPMAESAQTITATVTPSDAFNQELDWSVEWVNPSSTWASGKSVSDYVTVIPESDGARKATVSCFQAFGEQIHVVATSRDNSDVSGKVTVDYRQCYVGTMASLPFVNSEYYDLGSVVLNPGQTENANMPNKTGTSNNTNTVYSPANPIVYNSLLSDTYTIALDDNQISFTYSIKLNPTFSAALKSASGKFTDSNMAVNWVTVNETSGNLTAAVDGVSSAENVNVLEYYYNLCNPLRAAVAPYVYYLTSDAGDFIRAAKSISDYHFQIKVVAIYGGQSYESIGNVKFAADSLNIPVNGISMSGGLVF